MGNIHFFKNFLSDWRTTGSITPSSRFLVRKMTSHIDWQNARLIVELGPGSGPMTKHILKNMHPDCRLIAFELNQRFCKYLEGIDDKRLKVIHDSAQNMNAHLGDRKADSIISGIPLSNIPSNIKKAILLQIKNSLAFGGTFAQFQYSLREHGVLKKHLGKVDVGLVPLNIPPAFVYLYSKF